MERIQPLPFRDASREGTRSDPERDEESRNILLLPQRRQSRHCRRPSGQRQTTAVADPHWWAR